MASAGTSSFFDSAMTIRSARRQTVRQTCSSVLSRHPPGSTNEGNLLRSAFISSISDSSLLTSASVTRGCLGWTSAGSVARIEPRLNSSCWTRTSVSARRPISGDVGASSRAETQAIPRNELSSSTVP